MRIAQIMLARRLGGGEQVFLDLCAALASRGHEVLAIGATESDAMNMLDHHHDLRCDRVRCFGTWDPLCRRAIGRLLRRFDPDLVQTHMARASALGGTAARAAGFPTLAMLHNMINLKYYRSIDLFIPTTTDQYGHLRKGDVPLDQIELIPHFRRIEPVAAATIPRRTHGVAKALGRFVHKKGFDILLHAVAISASRGSSFRLEIGGDGPQIDSLKQLTEQLGIGSHVKFCGWIDDVANWLGDADVFVLPSRIEPFGIVVLEAMACGIPIVATQVSGPLEILDERTALLVPSENPEALAEAMIAAFGAPDESEARAHAALDKFQRNYSESVIIDRYLTACERLVSKSRTSR